ncbi:MAG: stage II sporulation protein M [Oscillibacter sp.]|nr:stage II sporulation protein M [Oscillibacter sp.]
MDRRNHTGTILVPVLCLSLCFLIGAGAGQALAFASPDAAAPELRRSLTDYYRNREQSQIGLSLALSTLGTWFRAPALVFLWGFTSLGVPLVCLSAAAFGFLLSFSVGCFAAAFGWEGVLLSASAMGLRAVVTLPCFFLLALSSMERAGWLFRLSIGRAAARPDRRVCVAVCSAALLAGAALDLYATPRLLRLALEWVANH